MRKLFLLFWIVGLMSSASAQQRLVIFDAMIDGFNRSVCIDYFRDAPFFEDNYKYSAGANGSFNYTPRSFSEINVEPHNKGAKFQPKEPVYISANDDLGEISQGKKAFVKSQFEKIKSAGPITASKISSLQQKIWSYDILELLGYLPSNPNAGEAYKAALQKFGLDFLGREVPCTELDVLRIGRKMKFLHSDQKQGYKSAFIAKSKATGEIMVFNSIAPPAFKGTSNSDLAAFINSYVSSDDIVRTDFEGFENRDKEVSFIQNLQKRMAINYNKDISFGTPETYFSPWTERSYTVSRPFSESVINQGTRNGAQVFHSSMEVSDNDYNRTFSIEGESNSRNIIASFFSKLSESIRDASDQFILGIRCRSLRRQVLKQMQTPGNNDYLDIIIARQGGEKDVVRINKEALEALFSYVQNN